ncbi:MAG TPA: tetratricopeptide repeat protein [Mizugakiibacter sp.]|nr:tetratricopeptide repeat protein [Mizugakiibacter sp.]
MIVLVGLPTVLLLGYLVQVGISSAIHGISVRPWNESQRLLTEPRVLLHYLDLLWLPRPYSAGLFYDGYGWSRSLWQPATTLPALLAISALLGLGWALRRRWPMVALAIAFYFAGQLMESTTIPLELVFEHRNYIPAMLMFWPLAWWLLDLRTLKTLKTSLIVVLPLSLAVLTHTRATLWGNRSAQALQWARINPDSPRAQAYAVQFEIDAGHPQQAVKRILPLLHRDPSQIQLAFNLLNARCALGGVNAADLSAAATALRTTRNPNSLLPAWFGRAIYAAQRQVCPGLTIKALRRLLQAGLDNRFLQAQSGRMQDLHYVLGRIDLAQGQTHAATGQFEQALSDNIRPGFAADSAALLGSAGYPAMGLEVLNRYRTLSPQASKPGLGMPMIHAWVLRRQDYWPRELSRLRATLQANIPHSATHQEPVRGP